MKQIRITLDRFEGNYGIFETDNRKTILIEKSLFSAHEGDVFELELKDDKEARLSREEQAKAILNEILRGDDGK